MGIRKINTHLADNNDDNDDANDDDIDDDDSAIAANT